MGLAAQEVRTVTTIFEIELRKSERDYEHWDDSVCFCHENR